MIERKHIIPAAYLGWHVKCERVKLSKYQVKIPCNDKIRDGLYCFGFLACLP